MLKQGEVLWKAAGGDVETATEKELRSTAAQNLGEPLPLLSLLSPSARQRPLVRLQCRGLGYVGIVLAPTYFLPSSLARRRVPPSSLPSLDPKP